MVFSWADLAAGLRDMNKSWLMRIPGTVTVKARCSLPANARIT
jgi:hypothetical protein